MPDPRHELGRRAEVAAAAWLTGKGWRVLARRWRSASGELDLVCLDQGGTLVAVEVKLRRSERAGTAVEAVDHHRLVRLRRTVADYARQEQVGAAGLRIDLVTVTPAVNGWRLRWMRGVDAW
jgi:putative endonuclease